MTAESLASVAVALDQLFCDATLRHRLGQALRAKIEREYATAAFTRRWEALFDAVLAETKR
jgi:glycosyltransferase involved in cell wall biosynthesis